MADPPSTSAQEPDRRRPAPPAFAAPVRTFSSSLPPGTTPAPLQPFRQYSGPQEAQGPPIVVARSDSFGSPTETQESSNSGNPNASVREKPVPEQQLDKESQQRFAVSNGRPGFMIPGATSAGSPAQIPMGAPPVNLYSSPQFSASSTQFSAPPAQFTSPLRPIPSFTPAAAPSPVAFSEIPLAGATPPRRAENLNSYPPTVDQPLYNTLAEDDFDASGHAASSSFVQFSAQTLLKDKKLVNTASLGFGALVSAGAEVTPSPPFLRREGNRCQNCGAYVNLFSVIDPSFGEWRCVFCDKLNSSDGDYRSASSENVRNWPELVSSVVDYLDAGARRPDGLMSVTDSAVAAPVIILIDECLDEAHLQHLQSSLHSFLDSLSQTTRIGIITFGKTVSVYDLSEMGLAAADVFPGDSSPSQELLKMLIYGTGVYIAPIHACLAVAQNIVSSLRPYRGDFPEVARDRCLGTAVEIALILIQGPAAGTPRSNAKKLGGSKRIIACIGGPCTFGVGSLPYSDTHPNYAYLEKKAVKQMEHLGHEARGLDTSVDLLCAGTCPVRIRALQPLVKASGGVLVLHDDFGEIFGVNMQRAVRRATGFRGVLEVRCPNEVAVTRIIGPGEEADLDPSDFPKDNATAVELLSVENCQGLALNMELTENITGDFAYFQFVARYTNTYHIQVTRVITVRLPTTASPSTYLQSFDDEVAAVLIAKKTVLLAEKASDLADARASIDERVKDIALKFGKQMPKAKVWRFPKELPKLPELLFHFRRGPLLGNIVGHEDERAVYRSIFLQASLDLALRMLAPRLLMHREGGTFQELPAYDLAMQSGTSLVMDHGSDLFIWTGLDVAANEALSAASSAACRTLANELTESRFPSPRMLAFKEASSQSRYLKSRLIPAHKDPPYEQEARFPQLRTLRPDQRARLKSSLLPTDDPSFCEWMRSLKLVPPEPSCQVIPPL
ncbi:hypothetical protein R1sor_013406 [Riccia sorocarpa]|uniref:Protein transport protein SEC23 n=1 Tax=Riccia sorocarpa TaxID=122646 RepID=A0ABD3H930_9MARC